MFWQKIFWYFKMFDTKCFTQKTWQKKMFSEYKMRSTLKKKCLIPGVRTTSDWYYIYYILRSIFKSLIAYKKRFFITVYAGEFGWVGFLVVWFQCKTIRNPRKVICYGIKVVQMPLLTQISWVGLALGSGVRWFHNNIDMSSTQHNLVKRFFITVFAENLVGLDFL